MGENKSQPFLRFGKRLRGLRERAQESVLEVSYAIEIDEKTLENIEAGQELPDEDILMLLISHFNVKESDAAKLWELAGYGSQVDKDSAGDDQLLKQVMMVIPFDNRISFSDTAHIDAKETGLVISFAQTAGNQQPQTTARIGMSIEQAKNLHAQLTKSLKELSAPKIIRALPETSSKSDKEKSQNRSSN